MGIKKGLLICILKYNWDWVEFIKTIIFGPTTYLYLGSAKLNLKIKLNLDVDPQSHFNSQTL